MAERLSDYEFEPKGRRGKYDWRHWFDGAPWRLCLGEDFFSDPETFLSQVHGQARRWGGKARTQREGDCVIVQFYRPES